MLSNRVGGLGSPKRFGARCALSAVLALISALCCGFSAAAGGSLDNILLIIVDDIALADVAAYGKRPGQPRTPALDRLASEGVVFRNAWSNPVCAPARAAVLTGRYAFFHYICTRWHPDTAESRLIKQASKGTTNLAYYSEA